MVCFIVRYKKPEERGALNEAMKHILPLMYQRCVELGNDDSEMSLLTQKQILKVFFALIQVHGYKLPHGGKIGVTINHFLKLFYSSISYNTVILYLQYFLPLDLITREIFQSWTGQFCRIVDKPIPEVCTIIIYLAVVCPQCEKKELTYFVHIAILLHLGCMSDFLSLF